MQRKRFLNLGGYGFAAAFVLALLAPVRLLHAQAGKAPSDTLTRVRQTSTLRLGYYLSERPFSYQDEAGKPAGYAVALCQEIAKNLKAQLGLPTLGVEFVSVTSSDRYEAVKQGKVDLLCGPSTETLARRKDVDFSIPIFPGGVGALMRADAPVSIRDALAGREAPFRPLWRASIALTLHRRTFSAVTGTTTVNWLNDKRDEFKIEAAITQVENHEAGVQRVLDRTTDVLFGERSILLDAAKRSPASSDLIVFDRLFTYEPLALALTRGDEDFRLLVDRSLSGLYRSGAIQAIYKNSFGDIGENTLTFFRMSAVPE